MDDTLRPKHHINPPAQCDSPKDAAAISPPPWTQGKKLGRLWRGGHTSYEARGARMAGVAPGNGEERGEEGEEITGARREWEEGIRESREVGEQSGADLQQSRWRENTKGFMESAVREDRLILMFIFLFHYSSNKWKSSWCFRCRPERR